MNEAVVIDDMRKSSGIVNKKIQPIVAQLWRGWKLLPVEGETNEVCKILDMSCGVDYLLYSEDFSFVYGVASRVQYGKNYRTFTVRKERDSKAVTEYEKRVSAIHNKALYPKYTMQSYIVDENVIGLAIVKTADLIDFIGLGRADVMSTNIDKIGQAEFYVCKWDLMKDYGYTVLEYGQGENS